MSALDPASEDRRRLSRQNGIPASSTSANSQRGGRAARVVMLKYTADEQSVLLH
ncbi:MAG: hypothetical protein KZQ92_16835 [Candidatus Thiodiazotropha sp. (ex Lucinoma borealis)]|nr:hypothetical protein [Candidatus Thiodiazotropha sp. (ex Lucinoma borealis)]